MLLCRCQCHRTLTDGDAGVDVRDPVGAITACSKCRAAHCAAFLSTDLANDPLPREKTPWVEPSAPSDTIDQDDDQN